MTEGLSPAGDGAWTGLAPAKLNLFLHVVGRRADGYHLLQSVFTFLDYGDTIRVSPRADGEIHLTAPLPGVAAEQDLCVRAARLLQTRTGCTQGADIEVSKRLPMGGGLGGGSSDAATVLLLLNRLWGLGLSRDLLQAWGLSLGADVPVFLFGETAFAEGVGEQLCPVSARPYWYLVLIPPVMVPTPAVFAAPELTRDSIPVKMAAFPDGDWFRGTRNDLEPVVVVRYPEVAAQLAWLRQHAPARMTGSGCCVFAWFDSADQAQALWARRPAGWQGFVAQGLLRHPLGDGPKGEHGQ